MELSLEHSEGVLNIYNELHLWATLLPSVTLNKCPGQTSQPFLFYKTYSCWAESDNPEPSFSCSAVGLRCWLTSHDALKMSSPLFSPSAFIHTTAAWQCLSAATVCVLSKISLSGPFLSSLTSILVKLDASCPTLSL